MKLVFFALIICVISLYATPQKSGGAFFQNTTHIDSTMFIISSEDSSGIFNKGLTKIDLVKIFGAENVGEKSEWREEGTVEITVTVIYPNTNNEATLLWKKDGTLAEVIFVNPNSDWVIDSLKVGMTLSQVEEINDTSFSFYGFGWDNGGFINDWNNGTFSKTINNIEVSLNIDWETIGNKNIDKFMGDVVKLNSSNKEIQELGITIYSITLKY